MSAFTSNDPYITIHINENKPFFKEYLTYGILKRIDRYIYINNPSGFIFCSEYKVIGRYDNGKYRILNNDDITEATNGGYQVDLSGRKYSSHIWFDRLIMEQK